MNPPISTASSNNTTAASATTSSNINLSTPVVLGPRLVGEKLHFNENRVLFVEKLLGEGAFSYVYLVSDLMSASNTNMNESNSEQQQQQHQENVHNQNNSNNASSNSFAKMVLKATAVQSQEQREITQKETVLLRSLSHPNIIQLVDTFSTTSNGSKMHHHMLLMEYMPDGHALHVIQNMMQNHQRYTLASLIVAFGQICNAVSYLHAQRPPITHRDLKLENFLVSNNCRTYKLCDFGSAVIGHIPLTNSAERAHAEMVLQRTTTPMYRAPEMVDLYMCPKLTQSTDVWALGCCLYAMAFFKHCFGGPAATTTSADVTTTNIGNPNAFPPSSSAAAVASGGGSINLAILSGKYKIPTDENNPYPESVTQLIHRMLTLESNKRADMSEVIKSLSAIYGNRSTKSSSLRYKQRQSSSNKRRHYNKPMEYSTQTSTSSKLPNSLYKSNNNNDNNSDSNAAEKKEEKCGIFRTDGQGQISADMATLSIKPVAKKLDPNSAAARRKAGRSGSNSSTSKAHVLATTTAISGVDVPTSKYSTAADETVAFAAPPDSTSPSRNTNQSNPQRQQQSLQPPKTSSSVPSSSSSNVYLNAPFRLKKIESGASQASSITSEISKEFEELDEESFCFGDFNDKDHGSGIFRVVNSNPFASSSSYDNDDDPFHFEEMSNSAATSSSLNNKYTSKTVVDPSTNSVTSTNRMPPNSASASVANQFIFDSVGFCVSRADSYEDNTVMKSSSRASSTATSTHSQTKGVGIGATQENTTTLNDPTEIQLTFSI